MDNGALKKVTYPTKGYTEYSYEANEIYDYIETGSPQTITDQETCSNGNCCSSQYYNEAYLDQPFIYTFSQEQLNTGTLYLTLDVQGDYPGCPTGYQGLYFRVSDLSGNSAVVIDDFSFNSSANSTMPLNLKDIGVQGLQASVPYEFYLKSTNSKGELRIDYIPNDDTTTPVGGLRTSSVKTNDGISSANDIIKTYEYLVPNTTKSSGRITNTPKYHHFISNNGNNKVLFTSSTVLPLSTSQGYHINYSDVRESRNGNGFTDFSMKMEKDVNSDVPDYPAKPSMLLIENGTLKEQKVVRTDGANQITEIQTNTERDENDGYSNVVGVIYAAKKLVL